MITKADNITKDQILYFRESESFLREYHEAYEKTIEEKKILKVRNEECIFILTKLRIGAEKVGLYDYKLKLLRYSFSATKIQNDPEFVINDCKCRPGVGHLVACLVYLLQECVFKQKVGIGGTGAFFTDYVNKDILYKYFKAIVDKIDN